MYAGARERAFSFQVGKMIIAFYAELAIFIILFICNVSVWRIHIKYAMSYAFGIEI